jgi:hypothetical protein
MHLHRLATRSALLLACLLTIGIAAPAAANDNGRGRHKQLYAVPAPGKVTIDGKLDDWDLSGQIEMFVIQATRGTMNAKFAVMYDADAIYLGADVNDPNPMMNMRSPETDPMQGWNADSCQFRLTTDPKVGYPILDESTFKYKGKGDATETRDDIVHLTLWHYTETSEPQLERPARPRAAGPVSGQVSEAARRHRLLVRIPDPVDHAECQVAAQGRRRGGEHDAVQLLAARRTDDRRRRRLGLRPHARGGVSVPEHEVLGQARLLAHGQG